MIIDNKKILEVVEGVLVQIKMNVFEEYFKFIVDGKLKDVIIIVVREVVDEEVKFVYEFVF